MSPIVTPEELSRECASSQPLLLIDLRPAENYCENHLPGAVHLDLFGISSVDTDPAPLKAFFWIIEHLLASRGVSNDVAVVVWGEFGRAPRISRGDGRDHWPEAAAAVIAGGGFRTGQVIGATDRQAGESINTPYTPSNVLASLYAHMGIDTEGTLPDFSNRPMHVLDDRAPVRELH